MSAIVFVVIAFLMRVPYEKLDTKASISRIDWIGTMLFAGSITFILLGLIFGRAIYE